MIAVGARRFWERLGLNDEDRQADGLTYRAATIDCDSIDDAAALLAAGATPVEVLVLFITRPGEVDDREIEAVRALAPLARVVRVLGPWCEGEPRSGRPPAGCTGVYWHQWPSYLQRELAALHDDRVAEWSGPLTASPEERTMAVTERLVTCRARTNFPRSPCPLPRGERVTQASAIPRGENIAIVSSQAGTAAALADVCRLAGYEPWIIAPRSAQPLDTASAMVWDAAPDDLHRAEKIATLREMVGGSPIVAVTTFPRPDDVARAAELGLAAVVAKPLLIADLLRAIDAAVAAH